MSRQEAINAAQDQRIREAIARDPYASAVIDALAGDFPDLRDPMVADAVRKAIYANARTRCGLEVIVDDPFASNWRLIPEFGRSATVRLACWRLYPCEADHERMCRLNAALAGITVPAVPVSTEG